MMLLSILFQTVISNSKNIPGKRREEIRLKLKEGCAPGSEPSSEGCTPCPNNQVSNGLVQDQICPDGNAPDKDNKECQPCGAGEFSSGGQPCQPCADGSVTNSFGSKECTICPPYQYALNKFVCSPCLSGQGPDSYRTGCTDCPSGQYSNTDTNYSCQPCPGGSYSTGTGARECPNMCQAGTFSPGGNTPCKPCPPGTYSDDQMGECKKCPKNFFSGEEGSKECKTCEKGKVSAAGSAQCSSANATRNMIIGIVIAVIVVAAIAAVLIILWRRKVKRENESEGEMQNTCYVVGSDSLAQSLSNQMFFSNPLDELNDPLPSKSPNSEAESEAEAESELEE